MYKYRVSIIGLGYVGLTTAVALASRGFNVIGIDANSMKVEKINNGELPFYEPGLRDLLIKVLDKKRFHATTDYKEILNTNITFICVGTPSLPDGRIDLSQIVSATKSLGNVLRKKNDIHFVVVKSTVIPGTTRNVVGKILVNNYGKRLGENLGLCMNPEFLREGTALYDTFNPGRVVIGEYDKKSGDILENLWRTFYRANQPPILRTSLEAAEMIKYASNAFLATKISFANTIANICQHIPNCDVLEVLRGVGLDHRINPAFLGPGLGFGGSCFPKDVKALISFSKDIGYEPILLEATLKVNEEQPYKAIELAKKHYNSLKGLRVTVLGLAFKPNTDDMRGAVSIKIINKLLEEGAKVVVHDPKAVANARKIFSDKIEYASDVYNALKGADLVIIVTEWDEYKKLTPSVFKTYMRRAVIIDGRRIYNPQTFRNEGISFYAIGLSEGT